MRHVSLKCFVPILQLHVVSALDFIALIRYLNSPPIKHQLEFTANSLLIQQISKTKTPNLRSRMLYKSILLAVCTSQGNAMWGLCPGSRCEIPRRMVPQKTPRYPKRGRLRSAPRSHSSSNGLSDDGEHSSPSRDPLPRPIFERAPGAGSQFSRLIAGGRREKGDTVSVITFSVFTCNRFSSFAHITVSFLHHTPFVLVQFQNLTAVNTKSQTIEM